MKILFFSRFYYPHVGGVEKHITEISQELVKKGHKVTIITTKYSNDLVDTEIKNSAKIIRFNQPGIKYLGIINTWIWLFKNRSFIKESDIVHIHDVFIWYWPFKIICPRKKVYVTNHGQWGNYPISFSDNLQKKISSYLSSGVISIGEYIDKNYGIQSDIISYGATSSLYSNELKKDVILYVGRLDKNVPILSSLKSFRKSKSKIIFCGDGKLKDECAKYGEVLGFVDPKPYYKKAKYVFASGYLTILEALSNKCLVFMTYQNPLQKDYYELTPFKDLVVISNSSEELFNKLEYYRKNQREAQILIEKGYNWVKHQTWKKLAEEYKHLWFNNMPDL